MKKCHWWRCQKCGEERRTRTIDFFGDAVPPRTPCPVCRDKAVDYHYYGYGNYPSQQFLERRSHALGK